MATKVSYLMWLDSYSLGINTIVRDDSMPRLTIQPTGQRLFFHEDLGGKGQPKG